MVEAVDEPFHSWFFHPHSLSLSRNLNVWPRSLMTLTAFLWIYFFRKKDNENFKHFLAEIGENRSRHPPLTKHDKSSMFRSTRHKSKAGRRKGDTQGWWDKSEKIKFYLLLEGLQWMRKFTNYNVKIYRLKHCLSSYARHVCWDVASDSREAVMFI